MLNSHERELQRIPAGEGAIGMSTDTGSAAESRVVMTFNGQVIAAMPVMTVDEACAVARFCTGRDDVLRQLLQENPPPGAAVGETSGPPVSYEDQQPGSIVFWEDEDGELMWRTKPLSSHRMVMISEEEYGRYAAWKAAQGLLAPGS